jgi:O-antigen ligase
LAQHASQLRPKRRPPHRAAQAAPESLIGWQWLTRLALGLSLAIVIARLMMLESVRSAWPVAAGSADMAAPVPPGPASGLVLDLLACLPALMVLARRWLDPTFALRFAWSHVPMALLGVWAVLSPTWADDKFAAAVSSAHWLAAVVMLWAVSQVVYGWNQLRLVAAVCFGMLLVHVAQGVYHEAVEHPELRRQWQEEGPKILRERGMEPGSFDAIQFENKVLRGELMGFSASPNTYAAVVVLLAVVSAGAAIQKVLDGRYIGAALVAAGVATAAYPIYFSQSRTAYATPVLAAGALVAIWVLREWLARHACTAFWIGVSLVVLVAAAVVGHGLRHGTLFHESLTFRWRYWVGSARLFKEHLLVGVGWENFGTHYLSTRLMTATEDIKDPHNFVVRFFIELGLIGGVLLLAWMLLLWGELTALPSSGTPGDGGGGSAEQRDLPQPPPRPSPGVPGEGEELAEAGASGTRTFLAWAAVAAAGVLINIAASVDFDHSAAFATIEVFRRGVFLIVLVCGMSVVGLRVRDQQVAADEGAAPWVLYGMLVGLGVFLLHNLVDFSLFELGPMFLFALLAGAALGARLPPAPPHPQRRRLAAAALAAGVVLWIAAAAARVAPVAAAEADAHAGDAAFARGAAAQAAARLEEAFRRVPTNADYAVRAAQAWRLARDPARARALMDAAVAAEPGSPGHRVLRADLELTEAQPDASRVLADYAEAVRLDPKNVPRRVRYGELLERFGQKSEALHQYEQALSDDAQLPSFEKRRLPERKVAELRERIAKLRGTS